MTKDFVVDDRRGKNKIPDDARGVAPASLIQDEVQEDRVTPETNFIHPLGNRVIVVEDKFQQPGRIFTPQKVERRPTTGTILEIGPGLDIQNYGLSVGDKVGYGLYSGTVFTFKGWDPTKRINLRMLGIDEIQAKIDVQAPELEGVGT